jgi:hypothetical protein
MRDLGYLARSLLEKLVRQVGEGTSRRDLLADARLRLVGGVPLGVAT